MFGCIVSVMLCLYIAAASDLLISRLIYLSILIEFRLIAASGFVDFLMYLCLLFSTALIVAHILA